MVLELILAALVALFLLVLRRASEKPRLISSALNAHNAAGGQAFVTPNEAARLQRLVAHAAFQRIVRARFRPTPWLLNGHLQTVFSAKGWNEAPAIEYHRQILEVEAPSTAYQHGTVALDWAVSPSAPEPTTPTVLILHGLTGGSRENYVRRLVAQIHSQLGWRAIVMNARGCGQTTLKSPQAYCAAYTEDVRQVVKRLSATLPQSPLFACGFSLGSNIMVKFLGEEGPNCLVKGAVSIANPFDLETSSAVLHSGCHRIIYAKTLAQNLVNLFKLHESHFRTDSRINMDSVLVSATVREFDDRLTRKTFGYATVDDYYRDASCVRFIPKIRCPLLCLNALDDPISARSSIPYKEISENPFTVLLTTNSGGHSMDWFTGCRPTAWSPAIVVSFLEAAAATLPSAEPPLAAPRTVPIVRLLNGLANGKHANANGHAHLPESSSHDDELFGLARHASHTASDTPPRHTRELSDELLRTPASPEHRSSDSPPPPALSEHATLQQSSHSLLLLQEELKRSAAGELMHSARSPHLDSHATAASPAQAQASAVDDEEAEADEEEVAQCAELLDELAAIERQIALCHQLVQRMATETTDNGISRSNSADEQLSAELFQTPPPRSRSQSHSRSNSRSSGSGSRRPSQSSRDSGASSRTPLAPGERSNTGTPRRTPLAEARTSAQRAAVAQRERLAGILQLMAVSATSSASHASQHRTPLAPVQRKHSARDDLASAPPESPPTVGLASLPMKFNSTPLPDRPSLAEQPLGDSELLQPTADADEDDPEFEQTMRTARELAQRHERTHENQRRFAHAANAELTALSAALQSVL